MPPSAPSRGGRRAPGIGAPWAAAAGRLREEGVRPGPARRHGSLIILALALLALAGAGASAATYYVSPYGDGDGSFGHPGGLAQVQARLRPGDTVSLRAGTYEVTIRPARSGRAGSPITYARYRREAATISPAGHGADLTDRDYVVLDGLRFVGVDRHFVRLWNAHHNIIRNCYLATNRYEYKGVVLDGGSSYNRLLNNELRGDLNVGAPKLGCQDLIWVGAASYNVIEGNRLAYAGHVALDLHGGAGHHNVIRGNLIRNPWHVGLGTCDSSRQRWDLIEGNRILDCGEQWQSNPYDPPPGRMSARARHMGVQHASNDCLLRYNVVDECSNVSLAGLRECVFSLRNYVYSNTITDGHPYGLSASESGSTAATNHGNVFKNNLVARAYAADYCDDRGRTVGEHPARTLYYNTGSPTTNRFIRNAFQGAPVEFCGAVYEPPALGEEWRALDAAYPRNFSRNLCLEATDRARLTDAGAFLTETTSAGTGRVVSVADAHYFYDGWGIPGEVGDRVQFEGQQETARIVSIDYVHDTVTLDRARSWGKGVGFGLAYHGLAPDIGSEEFRR